MIKNCVKNGARLLGVFAGVLLVLWLLLAASSRIPNEAIRENMTKSALSYKTADAFQLHHGEALSSVGDNYADAILLTLAYNMGENLASTIDTCYYDGEEMGENMGVCLTVTDQAPEPNTNYTRYWHGSAAFVRLLHLFTDVEGIQHLCFCFSQAVQ